MLMSISASCVYDGDDCAHGDDDDHDGWCT